MKLSVFIHNSNSFVRDLSREKCSQAGASPEEVQTMMKVYSKGVRESTFTLVLQGHVRVFTGSENFEVDCGPWSYLGSKCLTSTDFVCDYDAIIPESARLLQISLAEYQSAVEATRNRDAHLAPPVPDAVVSGVTSTELFGGGSSSSRRTRDIDADTDPRIQYLQQASRTTGLTSRLPHGRRSVDSIRHHVPESSSSGAGTGVAASPATAPPKSMSRVGVDIPPSEVPVNRVPLLATQRENSDFARLSFEEVESKDINS